MQVLVCNGNFVNNVCDGTLIVRDYTDGLPPLTYSEANELLAAIAGLWALAFVLKLVRKQFFNR